MKLIKLVSLFFFTIISCISFADENKYIFVGQNETAESTETAFILEVEDGALENHVHISENGEVYLKVDKIIAIPKDSLFDFQSLGRSSSGNSFFQSMQHSLRRDPPSLSWRCPNSDCKVVNAWINTTCKRCQTPKP